MRQLLPVLQLTRAALALTAVADAWTLVLLDLPGHQRLSYRTGLLVLLAIASACLYGFGMSLNDLLDARHDRVFARWRPIPSGRLRPRRALSIALTLLLLALLCVAIQGVIVQEHFPWRLMVAFLVVGLIIFYNATAKYLGPVGLLTLGAIRGFHAVIGAPEALFIIHGLILWNHVTLLSAQAYSLEGKRPHLRKKDWWTLLLTLALLDLLGALWMTWHFGSFWLHLALGPGLALVLFQLWTARLVRLSTGSPRKLGEQVVRVGLFWLFLYDATFLLANGQWLAAGLITALALLAWVNFQLLRWWSRGVSFAKPSFRRTLPP